MDVKRSGSQPSRKGPEDWFTGTVRIDPLFDAPDPARVAAASVTFEPGARTAWHTHPLGTHPLGTHPLGQTLIVTSGSGLVQRLGGPIEEIHPGDVVWFPPGEKHWQDAYCRHAATLMFCVSSMTPGSPRPRAHAIASAIKRRPMPRRRKGGSTRIDVYHHRC
jgi:quercetin dioxygenase-like cupin family protein